MAHFYISDELDSTTVGARITLGGSEGRHAATVSRVRVGETLKVGNGRGLMVEAIARRVEKDLVVLDVTTVHHRDIPQRRIILVQALAKNDRDERAIEACTELGIDTILPWTAERSISRWEGPKVAKGVSRWQAIVREATKQSIRPFIPTILAPEKVSGVLKTLTSTTVIVLDPTGDISVSEVPLGLVDIAIVVGPEGGITESELQLFRSQGAIVATLGANILRTSTAGPAALAIVSSRLRRL